MNKPIIVQEKMKVFIPKFNGTHLELNNLYSV